LDTKELRIRYHNQWPVVFRFPSEERLLERLASLNLASPIVAVPLTNCADREFHMMLSALLDALDALPLRPDRAFESLWTALDSEMFGLVGRIAPPGSPSRFQVLMQHIEFTFASEGSLSSLVRFMELVPMQSCEYAASRILDALHFPGEHADYFLKKVKPGMGAALLDEFDAKYGMQWKAANGQTKATLQRKAGAFLRKLLRGESITVGAIGNHSLAPVERLRFFVYAILPNVRNERFHGLNFSSYRSSATQMKTYAAGYFVLLLAYFLLLHVFVYRGFKVLTQQGLSAGIDTNIALYGQIFGKFARD
jgi:hypothetical protein